MAKRNKSTPAAGSSRTLLTIAVAAVGVLALGLLLLALSNRGPAAGVGGKPRLAVDRDKVDFGEVPVGKTVKATFLITNEGDGPLQILDEPVVRVVEGC